MARRNSSKAVRWPVVNAWEKSETPLTNDDANEVFRNPTSNML
jgi:hypothetical protein